MPGTPRDSRHVRGGGAGSRTRVRKGLVHGFYMLSSCLMTDRIAHEQAAGRLGVLGFGAASGRPDFSS